MTKRLPWPLWWLLQLLAAALYAALACLAPLCYTPWAKGLDVALLWIGGPLFGAASAYAAVRKGVNPYLAWLLPAACLGGVPWLIIGYPPDPAPMLICALTGVIGAAAGDVTNRRNEDTPQ